MLALPGLKGIRARKRDLLIESELNRQIIRLEIEQVRFRAEQLKQNCGWLRSVWKWVPPLAGFFMAARRRKNEGGFAPGVGGAGLLGRLWEAWQSLGKKPGNRPSDEK